MTRNWQTLLGLTDMQDEAREEIPRCLPGSIKSPLQVAGRSYMARLGRGKDRSLEIDSSLLKLSKEFIAA